MKKHNQIPNHLDYQLYNKLRIQLHDPAYDDADTSSIRLGAQLRDPLDTSLLSPLQHLLAKGDL